VRVITEDNRGRASGCTYTGRQIFPRRSCTLDLEIFAWLLLVCSFTSAFSHGRPSQQLPHSCLDFGRHDTGGTQRIAYCRQRKTEPRLRVTCRPTENFVKFVHARFLATFTFAICYLPSICRLSVVCNVRAPYSSGSNFRQYFYGIRYLGHPLTSVENFTEIVPGEPLRRGS